MTVGDPKKAMILSVVAVMIVGVAVFRAIPTEPAKPGATLLARQEKPEAPTQQEAEVPPTPTIDPFSHPNLSRTSTQKTATGGPAEGENQLGRQTAPSQRTSPPGGTTRQPTGITEIRGSEFETLPGADVAPAKVPGISQQNEGGATVLLVRLEAIVRGEGALALLSVAGKTTAPCREGGLVNGHIKVIKIKESSIVIESSGRRREIFVGEEVGL